MADLEYDPQITVSGSGPAVVLVPGMDGTGRLFYRQTPSLARSFRVTTYALRDAAVSMEPLVADLAHVIDAAAPSARCAVVIGESFGGALALTLAVERPDRVAALVVLNSFPWFEPQFRLRLAIAGLGALPWNPMPAVRRLTAFRMHSPHTHKAEIRRFLAQTAGARSEGYINRLRILRHYDLRHRLQEIRVPTLFLASDRDHLVPSASQARYMAGRVPGAVVRILEGHGHVCLIAPDVDLAAILREWNPELTRGVS
jgi:3-oxoadipate enol-lactonase